MRPFSPKRRPTFTTGASWLSCSFTAVKQPFGKMPVRRVIRIGAVPSGRWWRDLEERPEIAVLNVCEPLFPGLARTENVETTGFGLLDYQCDHCIGARAAASVSTIPSRLDEIIEAHPKVGTSVDSPPEPRHSHRCARFSSATACRFANGNLAASHAKSGTTFFANRGANGIDGIVSTFFGVSATNEESWLVIGDLSTLYDLSAPWILSQLPTGKRRIVVINNGGGKIFLPRRFASLTAGCRA